MDIVKTIISQLPPHKCPAICCESMVEPEVLMCDSHWQIVPAELRKRVSYMWDGFVSGDIEFSMYLEVRAEAVAFVNVKFKCVN